MTDMRWLSLERPAALVSFLHRGHQDTKVPLDMAHGDKKGLPQAMSPRSRWAGILSCCTYMPLEYPVERRRQCLDVIVLSNMSSCRAPSWLQWSRPHHKKIFRAHSVSMKCPTACAFLQSNKPSRLS